MSSKIGLPSIVAEARLFVVDLMGKSKATLWKQLKFLRKYADPSKEGQIRELHCPRPFKKSFFI
jgi:hypothetical protein